MRTIACLVVTSLGLAAPSAAMAVSSTTDATGAVTQSLSISAATPAAMTFTHASPGSTTSVVTVTSTQTSWTLTIADTQSTPTGHTAGRLAKRDNTCALATAFASPTSELTNALTWSSSTGSSGTLSGSAATVRSGTLIEAITLTFGQTLGAAENVPQGTCYKGTVTYTVT